MPKHIIEFNLPDETSELSTALNATKNELIVEETFFELFRPMHKHGYSNARLQLLIDSDSLVLEAIEILESIYQQLVEDNS